MDTQSPWASGPGEILKHALELLKKDSDSNRRLAMISIDNSVELTIKTFLGLPKRVTGLNISRSEYQNFSESYPKLLDALEKYSSDKLDGIDLGEIEWYHRLRNQLYHQGNGLTVERDKVEVYAELANILFANLFGFRLTEPDKDETVLLGQFMEAWVSFEKNLAKAIVLIKQDTSLGEFSLMPMRMISVLEEKGVISKFEMNELNEIRQIRNEVVHGVTNYKETIKIEIINRLNTITKDIEKRVLEKIETGEI
jgi:hypothetical protein